MIQPENKMLKNRFNGFFAFCNAPDKALEKLKTYVNEIEFTSAHGDTDNWLAGNFDVYKTA